MLIRDLSLQNVKCLDPGTDLSFARSRPDGVPHKWIVVYGDNGLGKTTLLRAIGLALVGEPALSALLPSAKGWARAGTRSAGILLGFDKGPADRSRGAPRSRPVFVAWALVGDGPIEAEGRVYPAHSIFMLTEWTANLEAQGGRTAARRFDEDGRLFQEHIASDEPRRGWIICGYGPHRRLTGSSSDLTERIPPDGRAARLITLFHERAALTSAEAWLIKLHHRASLDKTGAAQRRLDAVGQMIDTGLLPGDVKLAEITPDGVFFATPFSPRIPMDDLSDGYRSVLAMVLDLLRHVEYAFDIETVLETRDGHGVITAEGVVLIDEIDAHLHPSWQRAIGHFLHSRFPNLQFIVATHSPLIATRVSETEGLVVRLVRRKKGKGQVVEAIVEEGTSGLTADQVLTGPNFGLTTTRDVLTEQMEEELTRLRARVRAKKATPAERKKLKKLQADYERAAPATPTFAGVERWRDDEERIRRADEEAARAEGGRR